MKTAKLLRVDIANPGYYPDVLDLLKRIPESSLFHTKYPFRHPAAIYLLSLIQLAGDFDRVLTDYAAIRNSQGKPGSLNEQIERSQRILIYSLREYLDDCQMILMCLVDPVSISSAGSKLPNDALKAAALPEQKMFWNGVHNYVDSYLSPLVNKLKHSQGRFRTVVFECPGNDIRPGFFLEEVTETGTAQPSKKLHGGNSAFSYAKDLRSNFALVFRAADSLQLAVETLIRRNGISLLPAVGIQIKAGPWRKVCTKIAGLDAGVFPQEVKSRFFRVGLQPTGELRIREIEKDTKLFFPQENTKCTTYEMPDGATLTYRLPYFGANTPKLK